MIGVLAMRKEVKELKIAFFSDPKYYPPAGEKMKNKNNEKAC